MQILQVLLQSIFVLFAALLAVFYGGQLESIFRYLHEVYHGKPGCNPLPAPGNVTLHYFAFRGRAEVIRLLMQEEELAYKEKLYTNTQWPEYKTKGIQSKLFKFGQVPAMETDLDLQVVQSQVILHHLARSSGRDCDCEDISFCSMLAWGVEDAQTKLGDIIYNTNFNLADREDYIHNVMPVWLNYFEELAPPLKNLEKSFFASGRLTWVDFLVFDWLENNMEFARFDFGPTVVPQKAILSSFPKLNNFYQYFAARPRIAKYRTSPKRIHYSVPNMPVAKEMPH